MGGSFKEEKSIFDVYLRQHHSAGSYYIKECDYIHDSNGIEDHVSWSSQGVSQGLHGCLGSTGRSGGLVTRLQAEAQRRLQERDTEGSDVETN